MKVQWQVRVVRVGPIFCFVDVRTRDENLIALHLPLNLVATSSKLQLLNTFVLHNYPSVRYAANIQYHSGKINL